MPRTRRLYRPNSQEATATLIARLIARDGRLDWREVEFLDRSGTLGMLGIDRNLFMTILSRHFGLLRTGQPVCSPEPEIDAITDRNTQLVLAAALLYLAEIDGLRQDEREFVTRAWRRWGVTEAHLRNHLSLPGALLDALRREPLAA